LELQTKGERKNFGPVRDQKTIRMREALEEKRSRSIAESHPSVGKK